MSEQPSPTDPPRRTFLAGTVALLAGGLAGLAAVVPGLRVLLDPIRRTTTTRGFVQVARLAAVPEDGTPRRFEVIANRRDAWTTYGETPVGAVYLRRVDSGNVIAFNVTCPHAGCFVAVKSDESGFGCPCHNSSFALDGTVDDPASPSPRAMDRLDVELRNSDEVWVRFVNFQPGVEDQVPLA